MNNYTDHEIANNISTAINVAASEGKKHFPSKVKTGIEIELENFFWPATPTLINKITDLFWEQHGDSSLRESGGELVLRKPLSQEQLYMAIKIINTFIKNLERTPRVSHRCSVHVHLDFTTKKMKGVYKFIYLYTLLEPLIYTIADKTRYYNIYSTGFTHTTQQPAFLGIFSNTTKKTLAQVWNKYTGMNLSPLDGFGSIEIRSHAGTIDEQKLLNWVSILNHLYYYAENNTQETILDLAKLAPEDVVNIIFPQELVANFDLSNLKQFWHSAIRNILHMKLAFIRTQQLGEDVVKDENNTNSLLGLLRCAD